MKPVKLIFISVNVRFVGLFFTSAHLFMQALVISHICFYILGSFLKKKSISMINNVWKCLENLPGAAEQMKALWVS